MSFVFKEVITEKDFDEFYETLTPSWIEKGYTMECILGAVTRYVILDDEGTTIGTTEMIPYEPQVSSDIDKFYPFEKEGIVADNIQKVIEIESISILPDYRKKGNVERIAYTILEHCRKNNFEYGIGLMNPLFYLAIRGTYKIPIKNFHKTNRKGKYYPIIIAIKKVYDNIDDYSWLKDIYKEDHNEVVLENIRSGEKEQQTFAFATT